MKTCTKCGEIKALTEFNKSSRHPSGFYTQCKICVNTRSRTYRTNNSEKYKQSRKNNYQKNIDKMRAEKREYVKRTKSQKTAYDVEYRKNNKDKIRQYKKDWEKLHKDDPIFKIKRNLRRRVHHVIKGYSKADSTFNLIGCTAEEFKLYIESQFDDGMSWDNYGPSGWHIDHKIPCYKFDLSDPEQQKQCFHFSNQRPLWAKDNLSRPRD